METEYWFHEHKPEWNGLTAIQAIIGKKQADRVERYIRRHAREWSGSEWEGYKWTLEELNEALDEPFDPDNPEEE